MEKAPKASSASRWAGVRPVAPVIFIASYGRGGRSKFGEVHDLRLGNVHKRMVPSSPLVATMLSFAFTARLHTEPWCACCSDSQS